MNQKRLILVSLVLFQMVNLFSQSVSYTYDTAGNRLTRTIIVQLLKSGTEQAPVINPKNLNPTDAKATALGETTQVEKSSENANTNGSEEAIKGNDDDGVVTNVYPNPNKGVIKIEIKNMPLNSINEMRLYDMSGVELKWKRNFESYSELDISQYKNGTYILRIKIGQRTFDWKII